MIPGASQPCYLLHLIHPNRCIFTPQIQITIPMASVTWTDALRTIPRLSPQEWKQLHWFTRWLIASRAAVLVMTFSSAAIGALMAALHHQFDWLLCLLTILGLVLAHAASNLFNDYFDYHLGLDQGNYFRAQYGPHALADQLMTPRQLLRYAMITLLLAIGIGIYLTLQRGPVVLWLMLAGIAAILGYSFSKRIGLGEPLVVLVWGPLMVAGTYYVITGQWSWDVVLVGIVYALGPTTVLFGKHIDKFDDDRQRGVRTLPILLGERLARIVTRFLIIAMYIGVLWLVLIGVLPWPTLLVFLALPYARDVWKQLGHPRPTQRPSDYPPEAWPLWFSAYAFVHTRRFGLLFLAGLAIAVVLDYLTPISPWLSLNLPG